MEQNDEKVGQGGGIEPEALQGTRAQDPLPWYSWTKLALRQVRWRGPEVRDALSGNTQIPQATSSFLCQQPNMMGIRPLIHRGWGLPQEGTTGLQNGDPPLKLQINACSLQEIKATKKRIIRKLISTQSTTFQVFLPCFFCLRVWTLCVCACTLCVLRVVTYVAVSCVSFAGILYTAGLSACALHMVGVLLSCVRYGNMAQQAMLLVQWMFCGGAHVCCVQ